MAGAAIAVIMMAIAGCIIIINQVGFIIIRQPIYGCLIQFVAGKATMNRRVTLSRRITTNIIKTKTEASHLILVAMLGVISWGQMAIGAVGMTIGVTHMLGPYVGVLMPMTLFAGGGVETIGILIQVNGPSGAAGSHFM